MEESNSTIALLRGDRAQRRLVGRLVRMTFDWWPVAAFLLPVLMVQIVWSARYSVAGHAAGHLQSATVVFSIVFVSAVTIWTLPERGRRDPLLWLVFTLLVGCSVVVMVGNIRVVDAIGGETWSDTQAAQLGPATPGFESGHDLAERGAWGVVLVAIIAAVLLWRRRYVSAKVAAAAASLSVIFPYWIVPGFGIVILLVSLVVARSRRLRAFRWNPSSGPEPDRAS